MITILLFNRSHEIVGTAEIGAERSTYERVEVVGEGEGKALVTYARQGGPSSLNYREEARAVRVTLIPHPQDDTTT